MKACHTVFSEICKRRRTRWYGEGLSHGQRGIHVAREKFSAPLIEVKGNHWPRPQELQDLGNLGALSPAADRDSESAAAAADSSFERIPGNAIRKRASQNV